MLHYTLNSGDTRVSPRSEVDDDVLPQLTELIRHGTHPMPGPPGYSLQVTIAGDGLLATVSAVAQNRPCITFGVAVDPASGDVIWPAVETLYLGLTEVPGLRSGDFVAPKRPMTTPWCAAITILATPEEAYWMADFERCVAWRWIEHYLHKSQKGT